ncbi:hypothetical protein [Magnetospirillum sp. UT-4]|uniref:hypothetical protein n=1 Tax=Magnetospirillum sp. UT-4 TaxID=2681467 RepID=UPI001574CCE2|nr:hypothetical protein [Magnetospirillum sp. UT-4]
MSGRVMGIVASVAVAIWAALPPGDVALDDDCRPADPVAQFSAVVTGGWFWSRQVTALEEEQGHLLALVGRGPQHLGTRLEERLSRLAEREATASQGDQAEREAAAQRYRTRRMAWLGACLDEARRRAGN